MTTKEFISQLLKKHSETGTKIFPDDFTSLKLFRTIPISETSVVIGEELFGKYEILSTEGKTVYQAEDINEAKYIIYSNRYFNNEVKIPLNSNDIKSAVVEYEKYLDGILTDIMDKLKSTSIDINEWHSVSNEIFMKLNLVRY